LEDRNSDSITDYINCTIILPEEPTESEIASAANIAARLGYETSSADFSQIHYDSEKVKFYDQPVIIIGSRNGLLNKSEKGKSAIGEGLRPGQGDICFLQSDDFFKNGGVVIAGYDATGLIASANYFCGRFPDIWKTGGKKYSDIHTQLSKFLDDRNIKEQGIFSSRIVIDESLPGIKKLVVHIDLPNRAILDSAKVKLTAEKEDQAEEKANNNGEKKKEKADRGFIESKFIFIPLFPVM